MARGVEVDHSTINRWVLKYAPELDKPIRPHLNRTNDSNASWWNVHSQSNGSRKSIENWAWEARNWKNQVTDKTRKNKSGSNRYLCDGILPKKLSTQLTHKNKVSPVLGFTGSERGIRSLRADLIFMRLISGQALNPTDYPLCITDYRWSLT